MSIHTHTHLCLCVCRSHTDNGKMLEMEMIMMELVLMVVVMSPMLERNVNKQVCRVAGECVCVGGNTGCTILTMFLHGDHPSLIAYTTTTTQCHPWPSPIALFQMQMEDMFTGGREW